MTERRRLLPVLAVIDALLLVMALVVAVTEADDDDGAATPPAAPATTTATTAPPGPTVQQVVPELQRFVERERRLTFKAPVKVTLLDDAAFRARVTEADDEDREEAAKAQGILRALGLLGPDVDLLETVEDVAGSSFVGYYDSDSKELVVRGRTVTPYVRVTLVHELLHALEDQHFGLNRELGDEADVAFTALAEGSALRIEERYVRSLSEDEQDAIEETEEDFAEGVPEDIPEVVEIAFGFPYAYGPQFVRALLRSGGEDRLNAAFASPPLSTEQVLEPAKYLRGSDGPKAVAAPRSDGPVIDDGEVGILYLALILDAELDEDEAFEAAHGWGGDHYVAWRDATRTCVRMDFVMDSEPDRAELIRALTSWAGHRPPGQAVARGTQLTSCG